MPIRLHIRKLERVDSGGQISVGKCRRTAVNLQSLWEEGRQDGWQVRVLWAQERVSGTRGPAGCWWAVGEEPPEPRLHLDWGSQKKAGIGAGGHSSAGCGEQASKPTAPQRPAQPITQLHPAACTGDPDKAQTSQIESEHSSCRDSHVKMKHCLELAFYHQSHTLVTSWACLYSRWSNRFSNAEV